MAVGITPTQNPNQDTGAAGQQVCSNDSSATVTNVALSTMYTWDFRNLVVEILSPPNYTQKRDIEDLTGAGQYYFRTSETQAVFTVLLHVKENNHPAVLRIFSLFLDLTQVHTPANPGDIFYHGTDFCCLTAEKSTTIATASEIVNFLLANPGDKYHSCSSINMVASKDHSFYLETEFFVEGDGNKVGEYQLADGKVICTCHYYENGEQIEETYTITHPVPTITSEKIVEIIMEQAKKDVLSGFVNQENGEGT